MFRCVDCKEESRYAEVTTETKLFIEMENDGHLIAEIAWTWDVNMQDLRSLQCCDCGGEVKIVNVAQ